MTPCQIAIIKVLWSSKFEGDTGASSNSDSGTENEDQRLSDLS